MGTLLDHLNAQVTTAITGQPADSVVCYSTYYPSPPVRNVSCWATLSGIDLTPIEATGSYFGGAYNAVLISPRHVLFAKHTLPPPWNTGDPGQAWSPFTLSWVTAGNAVVTRTVTNAVTA